MKKHVWALIVAALLAPAAQAEGLYLDGAVGSADIDVGPIDDRDTAWRLGGGWRWSWFGIEAGYVDFGRFEDGGRAAGSDLDVRIELDGFYFGVTGRTTLGDSKWYLSSRAGVFAWDGDGRSTLTVGGTPSTVEGDGADGTDWYAGIGVGYDFTDRWSVGAAYDRYKVEDGSFDETVGTVSLTTEVRF